MGKKSFLMILLAVFMLSSAAQAEMKSDKTPKEMKAKKKAMSLDEIKAKRTKNLDRRIEMLQKQKDCISNATTKKEIKECRVKYKHKKMKPKN